MKTKLLLVSAVFSSACLLASCNADYSDLSSVEHDGTDSGTLSLSVFTSAAGTKASSVGSEASLNDIQLLLFNEDGELYRHHSFTDAEKSSGQASLANVKTGGYTVYAAANAPSFENVVNLTEFLETSIPLGEYNSPSAGYVMCSGAVSVSVNAGTGTPVALQVSRYVARVTVSRITNDIPVSFGTLQINNLFLMNVVGNQNISADASASVWYNCQGVADTTPRDAEHIIGSGVWRASQPELTFASVDESVPSGGSYEIQHRFYGYPNSSEVNPSGFTPDFSGERTALVISASFNGHTYYYPVVMKNGFERNTSYDVMLTIKGEGADNPDTPVEKGSITATVTVTDWSDGASYVETI